MKAAIYVTKSPQDGLQTQMEQAFALIDSKKWEMVRLIHQDELSEEHKLNAFMQAVEGGDFKAIAVPSLDVFPVPVLDALGAMGVELEIYDPEAAERARKAQDVLAKQPARKGAAAAAKPPVNLETLANEPWKQALLEAFAKKD